MKYTNTWLNSLVSRMDNWVHSSHKRNVVCEPICYINSFLIPFEIRLHMGYKQNILLRSVCKLDYNLNFMIFK